MNKKIRKRHKSQTQIYNVPVAFRWGPALLMWNPTERERHDLALEILSWKLKQYHFDADDRMVTFHDQFRYRDVRYLLCSDRAGEHIAPDIANAAALIWCDVDETDVNGLFGDCPRPGVSTRR